MKSQIANISLVLLFLSLNFSCTETSKEKAGEAETMTSQYQDFNDPHSYARPAEAYITHLYLDIELDFESKAIRGTALLDIKTASDAKHLILDAHDLKISKIEVIGKDGKSEEVKYTLSEADPIMGQALKIPITAQTQQVLVSYESSPHAEALQWLPPELTAGKKQPFLLTQSQAILARTWVPIQDSPGIRFTYSAKVKAPPALMVLMSASNPTERSADGIYNFEMKQPIPAYLLALSAGDLAFQSLGAQTGVYADPVILKRAADEFVDVNEMITIAEGLYGPYRWERYDLVILPPSFPFGGMENPRLTFATPTILAGDRSLVSLVAHELAHSWSGNLVTNANWNDFWLNEGFTVYFELRIMEKLKGRDYSEMLAGISFADLMKELKLLGHDSKDTWLKLDLKGRNPDDGMTSIAYDKGYYFLRLLEETVGREQFDVFLKSYFNENAFKTTTTEAFLKRLRKELINTPELEEKVGIDRWVYGTGVPKNCPQYDAVKYTQVKSETERWRKGAAASDLKTSDWSTHEWVRFVEKLPLDLTNKDLAELDDAFHLTQQTNAEIQCVWYTRAVRHKYAAAYPAMEKFLTTVGRRKFLMPLYREMVLSEDGKEMALKIYKKARPTYHPISYKSVDGVLGWKE